MKLLTQVENTENTNTYRYTVNVNSTYDQTGGLVCDIDLAAHTCTLDPSLSIHVICVDN